MTLKQTYDLMGRERTIRWVLLIALALLVSGLEMLGALLVYSLLALVAEPDGSIDLPLIGDLRERVNGVAGDSLLLWVMGAMAVFFVVRALVQVTSKYAQSRIGHNAGARLSTRMLEGYLRWPYPMHLTRTSSELIRNGHEAVSRLVTDVVLPTIRTVAEVLILLALLVVMLLLAPLATIVAVAVVGGAAVLLLALVQPRLSILGGIQHRAAKRTLAAIQQSLFGIRDVKVLGREHAFSQEYARSRMEMARASYLRDTVVNLPGVVFELVLMAFIIGLFASTLIQGNAAQESLSLVGLFAYVGMRLKPSMQTIIQGLNNLKFAAIPLQDLHRDLGLMSPDRTTVAAVEPLPFRDGMRLECVSFQYESANRDALQDIDLTIRPGEQIGICGPTGSGKTTLTDIITGLLAPTSGRAMVDGQVLSEVERRWQANLGIVAQMVFLTDDTLKRNIALGVPDEQIDDAAVADAVRMAQLEDFVAELPRGLETTVGERGVRVSGGQRQRIAIARALYRKPDVLIFDEGTSALDNTTEAQMMAAIDHLRGDHTIILVAHRLSTVRHSDRIVFLENGRMTGLGSYDELRKSNVAFRTLAAK